MCIVYGYTYSKQIVSGGTVAFVLGFYDKLINSLNTLISRKGDKKEAITFLIKLGIGWAIGMAIASLILSSLFEAHILIHKQEVGLI